MRNIISFSIVVLSLLGASGSSLASTVSATVVAGDSSAGGTITVLEDTHNGYNVYNVANALTGNLLGFGVSAIDSLSAGVFLDNDVYFAGGGSGQGYSYRATVLSESTWNTASPFRAAADLGTGATFAGIYGAWESIVDVAAGENSINWYEATGRSLEPGLSAYWLFAWQGSLPASNVFGITTGNEANAYFTTAPISDVPVPDAGWLLLTGLVGLAGVTGLKRRHWSASCLFGSRPGCAPGRRETQ